MSVISLSPKEPSTTKSWNKIPELHKKLMIKEVVYQLKYFFSE